MVSQGTKIKSQESVRYWPWTIPNIKGSFRLETVSTSRDCSWLCLKLIKSDECWWKCQNRKCPDVSGLCPSSVDCSLWVAPRFQALNLKFESSLLHARANFKWGENQQWGRAAACPESKDIQYPESRRNSLKKKHSTDEEHSPETSGHLLRFWHFNQQPSLLFFCSNNCHAAYEAFLASCIICAFEIIRRS